MLCWEKHVILFGSNLEVESALSQNVMEYDIYDDRYPNARWSNGYVRIFGNPTEQFFVLCGVCSTPQQRRAAILRVEAIIGGCPNWEWAGLESTYAAVAEDTEGDDFMALGHAYVGPRATVGSHSVVLPGAMVHHEATLGDCVIVAPGAQVGARAKVGDNSWICMGAIVLPGGEVGPGLIVPPGKVVQRLVRSEEGVRTCE